MNASEEVDFLDCWYLTGPTAGGKSAIGLQLAQRIDAEILSLDSMALFRGMDIGTAKPSPAEQALVPHHLIDVLDPSEDSSIANYLEMAAAAVRDIRARGKQALFVGGTPLYLKGLLRGLTSGPAPDLDFRRTVEEEVAVIGAEALHQRLKQVDPLSAARINANDVRRMIRALEVYKVTGQPISHLQNDFDEGRDAADCRVFALDWPRAELHARINRRVDQMFANGLVAEVEKLFAHKTPLSDTALQAVGYREVIDHLEGKCSLTAAIEKVKVRTRQFAKRQCTWFRSLGECRMTPLSGELNPQQIADEIARQ
ncbi:tRNA (adenosine(37)-N6)-dimethylallyltransferase MiaA [Blastopirellula sp. J2-11]|uniref:tRNA (adenosine(37)-N6)-dimethylallyltransferase MiaA n=1 Tax=Blastopirellula sp. J2-11 TaxID=2943192 RepID=UPI0021CA1024|nr:tRNA (adenosine(37)-N6)-dimethylallyltransferase MiaA [Blastopirellula sp. J2-11]UUO05080.1 tRNA (adenosine(37)-N6)-dimethylallyltransferase MiaA [Blastopirellula sp. J2-11]